MTCGISRSSKEQEKQRQYQWVMQDLGCLRWASGNNIWHAEPSIGLWISPSKGSTSAGPAWIVGRCSWEGNWQPGEAGPKGMWKHPQGSRASEGVRRARGANVQLMSSKLDDSCPDWTGSRRTLWKEVKACSRWHSVWGTPRPLLEPDWIVVHIPPWGTGLLWFTMSGSMTWHVTKAWIAVRSQGSVSKSLWCW